MKYMIIGLACVALGWLAGGIFHEMASVTETADAVSTLDEALQVKSQEIETLRRDLLEKESMLAAMESDLQALRQEEQTVVVQEEAAKPPANPFMQMGLSMAIESTKNRHSAELEKLKGQLDLTPEQVQALEGFYAEKSERELAMIEKTLCSGSINMEELKAEATALASEAKYHTVSQLLKDILTPEQLGNYEEYKEQDKVERREASAYSQLSQLQRQFVLDEEQKDAVFSIYYADDYAVGADEWNALGLDPQKPDFVYKKKTFENERLLEELAEILTPEQLEIHRSKLEGDTMMQRKALQMLGGQ